MSWPCPRQSWLAVAGPGRILAVSCRCTGPASWQVSVIVALHWPFLVGLGHVWPALSVLDIPDTP